MAKKISQVLCKFFPTILGINTFLLQNRIFIFSLLLFFIKFLNLLFKIRLWIVFAIFMHFAIIFNLNSNIIITNHFIYIEIIFVIFMKPIMILFLFSFIFFRHASSSYTLSVRIIISICPRKRFLIFI